MSTPPAATMDNQLEELQIGISVDQVYVGADIENVTYGWLCLEDKNIRLPNGKILTEEMARLDKA